MPADPPASDAAREPSAARDAFAAVYAAHRTAIVRYLRRRLGDDAAEDAAAEVFTRAYRRFPDYRDELGTPLPWLYGIAGHVISERGRAERRRLRLIARIAASEGPAAGGRGRGPAGARSAHGDDPAAAGAGLDPTLLAGLSRLSAADRETLLLLAWGELSYAETAAAQGIPVGTVRSRMSRVRRTLEARIDRESAPSPSAARPGDTHV